MKYDFVSRPLCYVAGPYSSEPVENTHDAALVADEIEATGYLTACLPHSNLLRHLIAPHDVDYWYANDVALLDRCDCLLRIAGESVGADDEVAYANQNGIPVFHSIEAVVQWAKDGE